MLQKAGDRIVRAVERALSTAALWSYRRAWMAIALVSIISGWAWAGLGRLHVDADLTRLLPETFESVRDIEELTQRFAGVGYLVVTGHSKDPEKLKRFAEDIAPRLEALDDVRFVDFKRPIPFFEEHGLYFLDVEDIKTVTARLEKRIAYERQIHNPLYMAFEDDIEPPSIEFDDLKQKYDSSSSHAWIARQGDELYYLDKDKGMIAVLVKPTRLANDLVFTQSIVKHVQTVVDSMDLSPYGPDFTVDYTGRFKKRVDLQNQIQRDLRFATLLSFALVVFYVAFHFRRITAVFLVIIPLAIGLMWAYGAAGWMFGDLNILTAFIGAIITGLGIDHGIHLLARYTHERTGPGGASGAIERTFSLTGRAVIIAAITTIVGFFGLAWSEFRAFREFGLIAAMGMAMVVITNGLLLPPLLALAEKWGWEPYAPDPHVRETRQLIARWHRPILVGMGILLVVALFGTQYLRFNYDFRALEAHDLPSYKLDTQVNQILGYSQTPVIIMAESEDHERQITQALRKRHDDAGHNTTIDFIASVADLVPPNQEEKQRWIQKLGTSLADVKPAWLKDAEQRKLLTKLIDATKAEPFTREELPPDIRKQFNPGGDTHIAGFVLVFPSINLADGKHVLNFAKEIRGITLADGRRIGVAGEAMILADILNMVSKEAPPVLALTVLAVLLTLIILMRRFRSAMLALIPAVLTMIYTCGFLPFVGGEINYLNMVMIPVLFGMAVDGGVHIVTAVEAGESLPRVMFETGRGIAGAIITTALGFGALLVARHAGLNSVGLLSLTGLTFNLIACLIGLPALLWERLSVRGKKQ